MSTCETLRKPFEEVPDRVYRTGSELCTQQGMGFGPGAEGQGCLEEFDLGLVEQSGR